MIVYRVEYYFIKKNRLAWAKYDLVFYEHLSVHVVCES